MNPQNLRILALVVKLLTLGAVLDVAIPQVRSWFEVLRAYSNNDPRARRQMLLSTCLTIGSVVLAISLSYAIVLSSLQVYDGYLADELGITITTNAFNYRNLAIYTGILVLYGGFSLDRRLKKAAN